MIAYSKNLLDNLLIRRKSGEWFARGLITTTQMAAVLKNYPATWYNPNFFIRIGLFLFTWIIIGAALGFYSLFTYEILRVVTSGSMVSYGTFTCLLFGSLSFFFLEKFIKEKNWYGNGMDDALLYSGLVSVFTMILLLLDDNLNDSDLVLLVFILFLPVLVLASLRYLDRVVTLAAVICFYCVVFQLIMKVGTVAKFIMPFVLMIISVGTYVLSIRFLTRAKLRHYAGCLKVIKAASLIVFYVAGNYFVIRESSVEFFGLNLTDGEDIPMSLLFYAFTALVPLIYLFFGLKKKDKLMVWVALVLITISVLTFKYYFSLGHPEITLTTAGLVMIALAYGSIRYLARDRYGITFKDDPNEDDFLKTNAEALIIAQSFGTNEVQSNDAGVEFGGGEFGGGGSGNKF